MAGVAAGVGLLGTLVSTVGTVVGAQQSAAAQEAEAAAMERRGSEEQAAAQREAIRRQKEAKLLLSRQQAVAAASGGAATDSTVLDIMGDTAAEGQYQSQSAIYEGKARAAGLDDQAAIARMRAKQTRLAGFIDAGSTMLSGISSFAKYRPGRYGAGIPTYYGYGSP